MTSQSSLTELIRSRLLLQMLDLESLALHRLECYMFRLPDETLRDVLSWLRPSVQNCTLDERTPFADSPLARARPACRRMNSVATQLLFSEYWPASSFLAIELGLTIRCLFAEHLRSLSILARATPSGTVQQWVSACPLLHTLELATLDTRSQLTTELIEHPRVRCLKVLTLVSDKEGCGEFSQLSARLLILDIEDFQIVPSTPVSGHARKSSLARVQPLPASTVSDFRIGVLQRPMLEFYRHLLPSLQSFSYTVTVGNPATGSQELHMRDLAAHIRQDLCRVEVTVILYEPIQPDLSWLDNRLALSFLSVVILPPIVYGRDRSAVDFRHLIADLHLPSLTDLSISLAHRSYEKLADQIGDCAAVLDSAAFAPNLRRVELRLTVGTEGEVWSGWDTLEEETDVALAKFYEVCLDRDVEIRLRYITSQDH